MKYTYTFLLFALFSSSIIAQPAFTSMPVIVDKSSQESANMNYTGVHPKTTAGANQTWDYSTLNLSGATTISTTVYADVSGSPHASSFPNASYYDSDTKTEGYYQISGNAYNFLGDYFVTGDYADYDSDPQTVYTIPFNYNDTQNDTYSSAYSDGNGTESGTTETLFDGYGTLILPQGTFTNIARFRTIYNTILILGTPPFTTTYTGKDTVYYWMRPGDYYTVLAIDYGHFQNQDGSVKDSTVELSITTSAVPTGILSNSSYTQASVYPQPASGEVTVTGKLLQGPCTINISNLQGETVISDEQTASNETVQVNVQSLKTGLYVVEILNEDRHFRQKLIIK